MTRSESGDPPRLLWPVPDDWVVTWTAADHVAHDEQPALDLAPPGRSGRGEPIYAAAAGRATSLTGGQYTEWGWYVRIDHGDGWQTAYAHCTRLLVTAGRQIEAGQVIATAGDSGRARGVHLHFELWHDGARVDPAPFLGFSGYPSAPRWGVWLAPEEQA